MSFRTLFAVVLVLAIAVVFIAPTMSLEPTALRASQAAKALQVALVSAGLAFSAFVFLTSVARASEVEFRPVLHDDLLVLNCTRLC